MNSRQATKLDKGNKHVDFDEESNCWGHFGTESGFCYATYSTESEAKLELVLEWCHNNLESYVDQNGDILFDNFIQAAKSATEESYEVVNKAVTSVVKIFEDGQNVDE